MKLLVPLGLLGLIGILILIIIYIIKPNYQQKFVSSTYVWKLSLKYKKKKIPTSKLRNLLIIICQVLILTSLAFILTQPSKVLQTEIKSPEAIYIIDASASMRTVDDDEIMRFDRAVEQVRTASEEMFEKEGIVSVILASDTPYYLAQRVTTENKVTLYDTLSALIDDNMCTFSTIDLNKALTTCETVLEVNPDAKISLYTDNIYNSEYARGGIDVVNVNDNDEVNASIISAKAEVDNNNYYMLTLEVAYYAKEGQSKEVEIDVIVDNANARDKNSDGETIKIEDLKIDCESGVIQTVYIIYPGDEATNIPDDEDDENYHYRYIDSTKKFYSFKEISIVIDENDNYEKDNFYYIYGGLKNVIKVQYVSSLPNGFIGTALSIIKDYYKNIWDIQITEVNTELGQDAAVKDFDYYIFEHVTPKTMPDDGAVMLIDPAQAPGGAGITINSQEVVGDGKTEFGVSSDDEAMSHPVMKNVVLDDPYFKLTMARCIKPNAEGYDVLMTLGNSTYPFLLVKNEGDIKVAVLALNIHYSTVELTSSFPILMLNIFDYFFPTTVEGTYFEVNDSITLNCRGEQLDVSHIDRISGETETDPYTEFPALLRLKDAGTYTFEYTTYFGETVEEKIYVKVPAVESNIWAEGDVLVSPYQKNEEKDFYEDLLLWIAIALVTFMFVEWALHIKES